MATTQALPPLATAGLAVALASDLAAAACAGFVSAPLVAVIDEATALNAAGKKELWPAIGSKLASMRRAPVAFLLSASFLWLWAVCAATYLAANFAETLAKASGISPVTPVLLCSTVANMSTCFAKDAAFARIFGGQPVGKDDADKGDAGKKKTGMSAKVLSLWLGRDVITQFFAFTVPVLLAGLLPELLCRLSAPVASQVFTTPLHMLGMKLYNLPAGTTVASQWAAVRGSLASATFARQMRILPAYSMCSIVNGALRGIFLGALGA